MYFEDQAAAGITVPAGTEEDLVEPTLVLDDHSIEDHSIEDHISVDTPFGPYDAGPAGYDTDGDGRRDTVMVDSAVSSVLFTDIDGDGSADFATELTSQGRVTVSEYVGDGEWTVVDSDRLDTDRCVETAGVRADDVSTGFGVTSASVASAAETTGPVIFIDPVTGRWRRD